MLQKQHRLLLPIGNNATVQKTPFFVVKIGKNNDEHSRFGFIISKRVAKSAVKRNRMKRIVRSAVEQSLSHIEKGYDVLFIIKKTTDEADEAKKAVIEVFKKGKIWQDT